MRNGNPDKREYWGQLGFNGLEFGLEGPFKKGQRIFLPGRLPVFFHRFAGRAMGVELKESANYQDLSFKLHFPTKKAGVFSVTGLGGTKQHSPDGI